MRPPRRRVRPVRIGVQSADADLHSLQVAVGRAQVNISIAVDACKADYPQSSLDAWYALAGQCIAFAAWQPSTDAGVDQDIALATKLAEGASLKSQLDAWRDTLNAGGCPVGTFDWSKAPKNVPTPGNPFGDLLNNFGDFLNNAKGLLLLAAAWVLTDGGKRL